MAARTSREEVIAAALNGEDPSTVTAGSPGLKETTDIESKYDSDTKASESRTSFDQYIGVTKIEALYLVFGKGKKLIALWVSMGLIGYVWSLAAITTSIYGAFATSSFGKHTVVGTMGVINNIMAAVALPVLSKICDVASRPTGLSCATFLFILGYVVAASAPTIHAIVAGEALFVAGRSAVYQILHLLISDMTQLKWRGFVIAAYSTPFVLNGFLAGEITANIRALSAYSDAWRWGYGMFCIIIPVAILPSISILFWGGWKAKKIGALSITSSSYARRKVLAGEQGEPKRSVSQSIKTVWSEMDGFGLFLFTIGITLLLTPPTLTQLVDRGFQSPSLIAMYTIGGVMFIGFVIWDVYYAEHPIWPRRLMNRTFITCVVVDALHFFSTGLTDSYYNSWVFILKPTWPDRHFTYFSNIHNTGLCFFAVLTGLLMRFTRRYRWIQMSGLALRAIGEGINYYATINQSDVVFIMAKILISCGAGMIVTTTAVAAPASAPHKDLAGSMAILHMVAQLAGSVAGAIGASVWNSQIPKNLAKNLPDKDAKTLKKIFGNIWEAQMALPHDMVYKSYTDGIRPLLAAAIGTTLLALLISFFTKEIVLDNSHNIVEDKVVRMREKEEVTDEAITKQVEKAEQRARAQINHRKE